MENSEERTENYYRVYVDLGTVAFDITGVASEEEAKDMAWKKAMILLQEGKTQGYKAAQVTEVKSGFIKV